MVSLHNITAINTGATVRRRVAVVIPESASPQERDAALLDGISAGLLQTIMERLTEGPVKVVAVFAWPAYDDVGQTPASFRALYVRRGVKSDIPIGLVTTRTLLIHDGVVYLPEED